MLRSIGLGGWDDGVGEGEGGSCRRGVVIFGLSGRQLDLKLAATAL